MNEQDLQNREHIEQAGAAVTPEETGDTGAELAELRRLVGQYREAEALRAREEAKAEQRRALSKRMDAVLGGRRFVHERLREDVLNDFARALADADAQGRSDQEIFDALTKDRHYFASRHPAPRMAAFGRVREDGGAMSALRRAFGLPEAQ